jgi:hypothetical protein
MRRSLFVLAAISVLSAPPLPSRAASIFNAGLRGPELFEPVACRNVRERLLLPNGRVEYVTRQECTPGAATTGSGCRVIRERVILPNGSVGYISRNQC